MVIIYKIEFGNFIYFGSTKQLLCKRKGRHNQNLRDGYPQKLYVTARENNIEKLELIKLCECGDDERLLIENKYIQESTDKIILNSRLAHAAIDRRREIRRNYEASDRGKLMRKIRENKI